MGSATRFNYTMMGDSVNLAARCESGAKAYGVYAMTTQYTYERVQQLHPGHDIVFRLLDRIIVKGKTQSVAVYEILGLQGQVKESTLEAKSHFERGLAAYFDQNWPLALQCFEQSSRLEPLQTTQPGIERNPSEVFLQRCTWLAQHPPGLGWDGVFKMQDK
jgi:adenylate cyclase